MKQRNSQLCMVNCGGKSPLKPTGAERKHGYMFCPSLIYYTWFLPMCCHSCIAAQLFNCILSHPSNTLSNIWASTFMARGQHSWSLAQLTELTTGAVVAPTEATEPATATRKKEWNIQTYFGLCLRDWWQFPSSHHFREGFYFRGRICRKSQGQSKAGQNNSRLPRKSGELLSDTVNKNELDEPNGLIKYKARLFFMFFLFFFPHSKLIRLVRLGWSG